MRCCLQRLCCLFVLSTLLAACGAWFGEDEVVLTGERKPVIQQSRDVSPDPALAGRAIRLPPPVANTEWPQAGGYPDHAMHHLRVGDSPERLWQTGFGSSAGSSQPRLPAPAVGGGKVFVMDVDHRVSALEIDTGKRVWQVDVTPKDEDDLITGGLAYEDGRVFVTGGFAQIVALNARDGSEIWRRTVDAPIHAAPAVRDGRVFFVNVANVLHALKAEDGTPLWNHRAISETAGLVGGASPAIEGSIVVAPFTSGEIVALRAENGRVLWGDVLSSGRRTDEVGNLSHIRGAPVIDRGRVFAIGFGGITVALDLRTGRRIWDVPIGGMETPWVAGDYLYVISDNQELVCLSRDTGRIYWLTPLQRYQNEERRRNPILWSGPLLVSDRLLVVGSNGEALSISPYDGRLLGRIELPGKASEAPVVADGIIFFVTDRADLLAFR